jgi:hypothetical protein
MSWTPCDDVSRVTLAKFEASKISPNMPLNFMGLHIYSLLCTKEFTFRQNKYLKSSYKCLQPNVSATVVKCYDLPSRARLRGRRLNIYLPSYTQLRPCSDALGHTEICARNQTNEAPVTCFSTNTCKPIPRAVQTHSKSRTWSSPLCMSQN